MPPEVATHIILLLSTLTVWYLGLWNEPPIREIDHLVYRVNRQLQRDRLSRYLEHSRTARFRNVALVEA